MKTSISIIKSKQSKEDTLKDLLETNLDYIHLDIMDGKFVSNKTFTKKEIITLFDNYPIKLDAHLMVEKPKKYIKLLSKLNTEYITFHLEAVSKPLKLINLIKKYNIKAGISIKPDTDINELTPYLNKVDMILVMSVEPGEGGQAFLESSTAKINHLANYPNRNYIISVDGGINDKTIEEVKNADMVVSGSYVCMSEDYSKSINTLKK